MQVGEKIYIVENKGTEVYLIKGTAQEVSENSLIFLPLQPDNDIGIKLLPRTYYPKQKNIKIVDDYNEAVLIYLAMKLSRKRKCDQMCMDSIRSNTHLKSVLDIEDGIEKSKSQFPELWF